MKSTLRNALVLAALAGVAWGAREWLAGRPQAPMSRDEAVREIDGKLAGLTAKGFAGVVVLMQDGDLLLRKAYGRADRGSGRDVTPDTGFDIGSLVKPFTAIAILKLESEGRLRRSDAISRFFPQAAPDKGAITLQQLLSHSSGLPDIVDSRSRPLGYAPDFDYEPVSREELVRRAMGAKLRYAPGEKSQYSNLGYSLLGVVVERASGEPYEQYVRERIFAPAGMTRTGYLAPGWKREELACGYAGDHAWGTPLDHRWLADGPSWNLRANGGMISTADDLRRWIAALDGSALLTPAEKQTFFDLNVHRNKRGTRTLGAAGSNDIFDASYLWYVDERRLLIMLTSSDKWRAEELIPGIAKTMLRIRPATAENVR
jgi:CubicO group peptidase (beta-lactamase class C family)